MDISVLYNLRAEISLLVAIIVVLVADIAIKRPRYRLLQGLACVFMLLPLVVSAIPFEGQAFGGMYYSSPITSVIKTVLTLASLIVFMQTGAWLSRDDMRERAGEFLQLSTSFATPALKQEPSSFSTPCSLRP